MASGDVIVEFANTQLIEMSVGRPTNVGTSLRFPHKSVFAGGSSDLSDNDDLVSATITIEGSYQPEDLTGDAERKAYKSIFDGTKRYKITVTEV